MKNKINLSILTISILGVVIAGTPVHDKLDKRISGKSFGGQLNDNIANSDGLGALNLQHHSGSGEINNELKINKILKNIAQNEKDELKTNNILNNILNNIIGTSSDKEIVQKLNINNENIFFIEDKVFNNNPITTEYNNLFDGSKSWEIGFEVNNLNTYSGDFIGINNGAYANEKFCIGKTSELGFLVHKNGIERVDDFLDPVTDNGFYSFKINYDKNTNIISTKFKNKVYSMTAPSPTAPLVLGGDGENWRNFSGEMKKIYIKFVQ